MRRRIIHALAVVCASLGLAGLTPIAGAPPALAAASEQPGVAVRLNDFAAVTPTAPAHSAHPQLELVSVMAPWKALEPTEGQYALGAGTTMDQNVADARAGGYQLILRIMAGRLEPSWLVNRASAQKVSLLGTDVNATDYCELHQVVVPWDAQLKAEYTQLMQAIAQWLQTPIGPQSEGKTYADYVFAIPISMPSFQGTEMNWGYGTMGMICPPGTEGAGQNLFNYNKAAWDAIDPGTTTPVAQRETERRQLTEQAWRDAIDIHMAELPTSVDSLLAYGALFRDGQAAAEDIAHDKTPQYLDRLWAMTTNLQPQEFTNGTLGTYRQWCEPCYDVLMEVTGAGGLLGFQTASININDTQAKYQAAVEDGLSTYGMRYLETQPDNVDDYPSYLLTQSNNVQARIRAANHVRTSTTSVSCQPVTIGASTSCEATVADTDGGAKIVPGGVDTVAWSGAGTFTPASCTPDGSGFSPSCTVSFTPSTAGAQPVTAKYQLRTTTTGAAAQGDSNHTSSTGVQSLDVARRSTQTDVTCNDASVAVGAATTCTAVVTDTSTAPGASPPTGTVSWTADAGGTVVPSSCALGSPSGATSSCHVSFVGVSTGNNLAVTGTYGGGPRHSGSSDGATVRVTKRSTTASAACQSPVLVGSPSTCTVTITDTDSGTSSTPGGTVTWSGASGLSSPTCVLSGSGTQATCSVTYTPSAANTVTLTADYPGDASHLQAAASTNVTGALRQTSTSVLCDSSVVVGSPATCTATVTDVDAGTPITPGGTVTWSAVGGGTFSSQTCSLSGASAQASCSVTYTPGAAGTPTVNAAYGGDQRHTSGNGSTQITGTARSTSMSVGCDTPVLVGSASTCTATVTDTASGSAITPAGQITWTTGGSGAFSPQSCTLSGSGGVASCSVQYTPSAAAAHTVTATYGGSQQHGATSGSSQLTANARQTSTSVSCDTPVPVGKAATCTATVTDTDTGAPSTPSGTVGWTHAGQGILSGSSCTLNGSGAAATCSVTITRSGTGMDTVTATYPGDTRHFGSGGEAVVQTVRRQTTTSVTCDTPVLVGTASTCTATVTDTDTGPAITPSGSVTWVTDGAGVLDGSSCTLSGTGAAATCSVTITRADEGSDGVTAAYGGDLRHVESGAAATVQAVRRTTATTVNCDTPLLVGSTSTCTATVTDTTGGGDALTPTGTVNWSSNATGTFSAASCEANGSGATASCSVTYVPSDAGTHSVTAQFAGDPDHGSSSGTDQIAVSQRQTSTSVTCGTPITLGASSTCTATVTDTSPGTKITPAGAVHWFPGGAEEFSDDDCTLSGTGATATCSVTFTPITAGTRPIGATYGGTAVHAFSTGGAQVVVNEPQQNIALRSSAFAANSVGTDLVLPKPATVSVGDVMLAVVAVRSNPTVTPPAGWTQVVLTANGSNLRQLVFRHVAAAGEPASYRWTFNQSRAASGGILAYSGVSTASPVEAFSGGTGSSASISAPSATTTATKAMVVGAFSIVNGAAVAPPTGMTERGEIASNTKIKTEVADVIQPVAGPTGAKVATAASSGANVGQLIVLHASSGSPPPNQDPTFDQNLPNRSDAQGATISLSAHATDPELDPLTYSATGLPPGLSINASSGLISGTISGTAAAGSPYAVTVRVSDDGGATIAATDTFTWTVTSGGGSTVTFRDASSGANATAKNLVLPRPPGVLAGDVMVAVVAVKVNPTVTAPSGWTLSSTNTNGSELTQKIYTKVAVASEPASYQWNFNEGRAASGSILAYGGVSTSAPIEVSSVGKATSSALTAPSVTTAFAGTVVIGAFSINNASAIAPPAGTVERAEIASGSKINAEVADFVQASAGATGSRAATASTSGVYVAQLIALRPA